MKHTRPRVWFEAVILVVLYLSAAWSMAAYPVVERLLAGGGAWYQLSLAFGFVLLRLFVLLLAPGFFLVRWLLAWAAEP